ncbi:PEP-CTERM sorting domain-containing protein [Phragmitibacter flavus]|uniref:PEP-CTERM sorting domain-containing protein n=2 Tax=Phragmitibacter flavus TaxID=2576071 RepID=A0A5R8KA98_9BACT|nr:PEP-CTERM sorting domain-containing protein [Phragmitibacter flavus]
MGEGGARIFFEGSIFRFSIMTLMFSSILFLRDRVAVLVMAGLLWSLSMQVSAVDKANNADNLNLASSWSGAVPGVFDSARWTSAVTGANSVLLGADRTWLGIEIVAPGGDVTIGGIHTLTLSSGGINMSAVGPNLSILSGLTMLKGSQQVWNVGTGRVLTLGTGVFTRSAGSVLNVRGSGTVTTSNISLSSGIIGAWASHGTGAATRYATLSGGNVVGLSGVAAATAADMIDVTGTVNYDLAAGGALVADASVNTIRYTGASAAGLTGALQVNGLMNVGAGALTIGGPVTIGAARDLVVNAAVGNVVFTGGILNHADGESALTKTGNGTLTLAPVASGYTGLTTILEGVLDVGTISTGALGSGGLLINGNGILQGNGTFTRAFSSSANPGAGQVAGQNGGFAARGGELVLNFGGASAQIALNGSGYIFGNDFRFGSATADSKVVVLNPISINSNGKRNFTVTGGAGGDSAELRGVVSNGGAGFSPSGINKLGTGLLILSAQNTFTGGVSLGGGLVSVATIGDGGVVGNLGASSNAATNWVFAGGGIQYTGATASTDRNFVINAGTTGTIEVTNAATNLTVSGSSTATTGALTKRGPGTLTLTGTNLNTGMTSVLGGVLDVGTISSGALGGGGLYLNGNGVLQGNGSFIRGFSNSATPAAGQGGGQNGGFAARGGDLTVNFGGSGAQSALNTSLHIFGNDFIFGSATADSKVTVVNAINLNSNGSQRNFTVNQGVGGDSAELAGVISQQAGQVSGLTKRGNGILSLTNSNTYTGPTRVEAGTLLAGNTTGSATGFGNVLTLANSGAKLGGTGSITGGEAASITLSAGTFLMVGNTHGVTGGLAQDLVLGNDAVGGLTNVAINLAGRLQFDLFANDGAGVSDPLGENDVLRLFSSSSVSLVGSSLDVTALGAWTWNENDTWMLIDWSGVTAANRAVGVPTLASMPTLGDGLMWTTFADDDGFYVRVSVVPEPSRVILLLAGVVGMVWRRRRGGL